MTPAVRALGVGCLSASLAAASWMSVVILGCPHPRATTEMSPDIARCPRHPRMPLLVESRWGSSLDSPGIYIHMCVCPPRLLLDHKQGPRLMFLLRPVPLLTLSSPQRLHPSRAFFHFVVFFCNFYLI